MKTVKMNLAEQLKEELMERYGLEENQIKLEISIYTDNVTLGRQILAENDMYSTKEEYLKEDMTCDNSYGEYIDSLWVYKRKNRDDWSADNE
jgi:hypothetical protein